MVNIGAHNDFSPERRQTSTIADSLLIDPKKQTSVKFWSNLFAEKIHCEVSSAKNMRPFCSGINALFYPSHKSHNASDEYTTMHHFVTEMCTFLLQNGALWDMGLVHCGICATGLFATYICASGRREELIHHTTSNKPGPVFYVWLNRVLHNEIGRYRCNISLWLRTFAKA